MSVKPTCGECRYSSKGSFFTVDTRDNSILDAWCIGAKDRLINRTDPAPQEFFELKEEND